MKKITITITMILIGLASYSQNLIGDSFRDVKKAMNDNGYKLEEGYTDDKIYYLLASDKSSFKGYYFTDANICNSYVVCHYGYTYGETETVLNNAKYYKNSNGDFISGVYIARIKYLPESKEWYVIITYK